MNPSGAAVTRAGFGEYGRRLAVAAAALVGAPLWVAGSYALWLGPRDDYLGHYLAGCGATLGALTLGMGFLAAVRRESLAPLLVIGLVLVCIGLGGICEATLYRLAKFDEVDFCNQSLGAVLAGATCLVTFPRRGSGDGWIWVQLGWAVALVAGGYYFAFR